MDHFQENFSKNSYYRFMRNVHVNWLHFTTLLSAQIINNHLRSLTSEKRADCFVVDDSYFSRTGFKKTELVAKVFDHVSMTYKKGFRMMTLGWTDGASFMPINSVLLSSHKLQNMIGENKVCDQRTIAGKRRMLARTKGTDVMVNLIDQAMKAGHQAKYVLFDSWFSNPHQIVQLKQRKLDVNSIISFIKKFQVIKLLRKCGFRKEKGISLFSLFLYVLSNVFRDRSLYMQLKMDHFQENFSKNSYYRFMRNVHVNWLHFTTLLSAQIINNHLRSLTSEKRADCFVVDDSYFSRTGFKKTELVAKVFDHVSMTYKKGFRMMTLGWTDGASFMPINSVLLSSQKLQNMIGENKVFDQRTIAGQRRMLARTKGTDVMVNLIDQAMKAGHQAKYVLFDSWFSNPHQIVQLKQRKLDVIAMVKVSSKIKYEFEGERKNIKQIYRSCKKRCGRSRYLLSIPVKVGRQDKDGAKIDARIVCVRNRANRKDWLAIICTDMSLSEDEIIRNYGKRWDIEVFFKTCKSYLKLSTEYHGLSYDALTAHVAIVFTRYMLMSVAKRDDEDERTLGELFYCMIDELADITFSHSLQLITDAMLASVKQVFHASEAQIAEFTADFINRLPKYMQKLLKKTSKNNIEA
ncbi:transposase [Lactobacillus crispatus]|nr:transposase [Lactobacillus crispatus]